MCKKCFGQYIEEPLKYPPDTFMSFLSFSDLLQDGHDYQKKKKKKKKWKFWDSTQNMFDFILRCSLSSGVHI